MAIGIKKAIFKFIDKTFAQSGYVLQIRKWNPESIYEIDLHLPDVDMEKWKTIPRLKVKVDESGEYRDYTPANWNMEKRICTLLIETNHEGFGSNWAKHLRINDKVIFAPAHAAGLPAKPGDIACFGDGSAVGHFLALKQLTDRQKYPLQVVIALNQDYIIPEYFRSENPEFKFIVDRDANSLHLLHKFSETEGWHSFTSIYIAGHIPMVSGLRKIFKNSIKTDTRVYAHGFWS